MAENTKIEWCDHSFNPWVGCTKVSPACDHCYAEGWAKRSGMVTWGAGAERRRTSVANWRMPEKWNRQAQIQFSAWERFQADNGLSDDEMIEKHGFIKPQRPRVFCGSLCDVFDNAVPTEWRIDLMNLILRTPYLDWLLLTKRIGNAAKMINDIAPERLEVLPPIPIKWPYANVWIGATICNQEEADRDIPKLFSTPAAVRFVSIEPLLGPVDLARACAKYRQTDSDGVERVAMTRHLDWVIVGGESGPKARPMHPDWVRSLRDQCQAARVPFCFKQWGARAPAEAISEELTGKLPEIWLRHDGSVIESDWLGFFCDEAVMYRAGKKNTSRLLDGRTWDEAPTP